MVAKRFVRVASSASALLGGSVLEVLPKIDIPSEDGDQATDSIRRRLVHMLAVALNLQLMLGRYPPPSKTDVYWALHVNIYF